MLGQGSMLSLVTGQLGGDYVTATTGQTGDWGIITALEDVVFTSITSSTISGTLTSVPLPKGMSLYGRFSAFTLTSGKVIAYKI